MKDNRMETNRNFQSGKPPFRERQNGIAVTGAQWLLAAATVLLIVLAIWYFTSDMVPGRGEVAPPTSKEAIPELARDVIDEQQQEQAPDYAAALEQARNLRTEGKLADAQLLYFFAARGGYAPAAFELAEMYDPLHFDSTGNLMEQADPFQAYKWYQQASQAGFGEATSRLEALHDWAQQAAEEGDLDAEQLLLQWN
jgi:TPR repeat protein